MIGMFVSEVAKGAAPAVIKTATEMAVKTVTQYPIQTFLAIATGTALYQKGRADAAQEINTAFVNQMRMA